MWGKPIYYTLFPRKKIKKAHGVSHVKLDMTHYSLHDPSFFPEMTDDGTESEAELYIFPRKKIRSLVMSQPIIIDHRLVLHIQSFMMKL